MQHLYKGLVMIAVSILCSQPIAYAHKVTIFAWAEGDRIHTESKFSGGKQVKDGAVTVFDRTGKQLLAGRTDDQGAFAFQKPPVAGVTVVLDAGAGHRNSWTLSAADLGFAEEGAAQTPPASSVVAGEGDALPPSTAGGLRAEDVEVIVARQLEEKLRPLIRMVAANQERGPTASEIFGGIGYIVGLVGLGAYLRYRKENRPS